jgi:DNA replication protein DnaC
MWDQLRRLGRFSRLPENEVLDLLRSDGRLYSLGIGSNEFRGLRISPHGIFFGLASPILAFIAAEAKRPLSSFILSADERMPLPLSAYDLPEPAILSAQAALRSQRGTATILLYGKPGTGKTEFSRSLCSSIGMKALFLRTDLKSGNRSFSSLMLASRLADPSSEVLVLDEADALLNVDFGFFPPPESSPKKGMVNEFLDTTPARMIFISNLTQRIPDSVLRRFSCHLGFEDYGPAQRRRIWDALAQPGELFTEEERQSLSSRYKANPARVKQVIEVCASYAASSEAPLPVMDIATELLSRSDEIMYGVARKPNRHLRSYNPRFLNIDAPMEGLLRRVEAWRARFDGKGDGINLLFYGIPGTGKTAFAQYLAERLGLCPVVKRGSDLLSMWVGETEKNISRAFKEAEGAALIIDEADSLLSSREQANHSWERTQVNEILSAMESFPGLFIASTNLRRVLDSASLRRFTYKVEFLATAPEKKLDLLSTYFPALSWRDCEARLLSGLDSLTPGDVAVVARRLEYEPALSAGLVLDELRTETANREPQRIPIGFKKD